MSVRLCVLCSLPVLAGCVAYVGDDIDLRGIAAEVKALPGGEFSLTQAITTALRDNPELRQLAANARAAGAVTEPIELQAEYRGGEEMLGVMLDPVALLGLGPRGGALTVDAANAAAALDELAAARWRVAAAVAETFVVDRTLAALPLPELTVDTNAFVRAGLAAPAATARLEAARRRLAAEVDERRLVREHNRDALRVLLGRDAATPITFVHGDADAIEQPVAGDEALLARPDLRLPVARLRQADAEFRAAVAAQYPSLMLGPEIPLRGGLLDLMAVLKVPFLMHGRAEAARERREAARVALAAAWSEAGNGAADAEHELAAARSMLAAAAANLQASETALAAALVALQVEVDTFDRAAEAAAMAARDLAEHRVAAVALARAELRRARAFGWPRLDHAAAEARR